MGGGVYTENMTFAASVAGTKYRNLLQLGEGGTAHVYLAAAQGPSGFDKLVVMKTLKPSSVADAQYLEQFLEEARLAARLNHPNILQIHEVSVEGPAPCIVMEYLEGQPLSAILSKARGTASPRILLRVLTDVLAGLQYAHDLRDHRGTPLRLVHRDITPHNVFVTFEGRVKVLDFGVPRIAAAGTQSHDGPGKSKIRYMAREQIMGEKLDRRADVFAVGVMLWEALAGRRMWRGRSDLTVMNHVLNGDLPSPRSSRPDLDPEFERICQKALAPARELRYATAAEFAADLERAAQVVHGGLATDREIGNFVSQLFAALRRDIKACIDDQIDKVGALSWDEYHSSASMPPPFASSIPERKSARSSKTGTRRVHRGAEPTASAVHATRVAARPAQSPAKPNAHSKWGIYAAGAVLLALSARSIIRPSTPTPNPTASSLEAQVSQLAASAGTAGPAASAAPAPTGSVSLRLEASPPEATLFLDGRALPSNPYAGAVLKSDGKHSVRVEAKGYIPNTKDVVLDRDTAHSFVLERVSKSPANDGP